MLAGGTTKVPIATLKATFGEKYPYEKPFPYEQWPLYPIAMRNDYTEWRFNENTKVSFHYDTVATARCFLFRSCNFQATLKNGDRPFLG